MQAFDLDAHLGAQLGIEVRERFVEEERSGVANHRPSDGDALALAAREGRGPALQEVRETERFCCLFDALPLLALRELRAVETEGDVVGHGHMRIDGVVLEHHGDVPVFRLKVIDDAPVDSDLAAADFLEPCNHPQRCRLAASGRADQDHELTFLDRQVDPVDDRRLSISLDEAVECDGRH